MAGASDPAYVAARSVLSVLAMQAKHIHQSVSVVARPSSADTSGRSSRIIRPHLQLLTLYLQYMHL